MKTKLQQLEEKIRELCPELMELSFGCEVWESDGSWWRIVESYLIGPQRFNIVVLMNGGEIKTLFKGKLMTENYKVIGHPIQLHHVLMALRPLVESKEIFIKIHGNYPFGKEGFYNGELVFHFEMNREPFSVNVGWDLSKPFQHQSEDLHNFLFDLLIGDETHN